MNCVDLTIYSMVQVRILVGMLCSLERPDLVPWILSITGENNHVEVVVCCYMARDL